MATLFTNQPTFFSFDKVKSNIYKILVFGDLIQIYWVKRQIPKYNFTQSRKSDGEKLAWVGRNKLPELETRVKVLPTKFGACRSRVAWVQKFPTELPTGPSGEAGAWLVTALAMKCPSVVATHPAPDRRLYISPIWSDSVFQSLKDYPSRISVS